MIPETERISDERLKELIYTLDVTDNPEAADALRELVRLREGWVIVKDRLPSEDSELLLLFLSGSTPEGVRLWHTTTFGTFQDGKWLDYNDTTDDYPNEAHSVTHWRELPAPPVMEKQGVPVVDVPKLNP